MGLKLMIYFQSTHSMPIFPLDTRRRWVRVRYKKRAGLNFDSFHGFVNAGNAYKWWGVEREIVVEREKRRERGGERER